MTARPRPAPAPAPLGDPPQAYAEAALVANLLVDPAGTLQACRDANLCSGDVSLHLAHVLRATRDLIAAGELVDLELLATTLEQRKAEHPGDVPGWRSFLTRPGLPDFNASYWSRNIRARAIRARLVAAAQAAAERRLGALEVLAAMVTELQTLEGAP